MKILYIIFLVFVFAATNSFADPVDSLTAKQVAENFYTSNSNKTINTIILTTVEKAEDGSIALYVFNVNTNDGWVMVSADDAATPILGYNTTGHFTGKNMSPQFLYWKDCFKKQISTIKIKKIKPTDEIKTNWKKYRQISNNISYLQRESAVPTPPIVGPLLGDIKWHQYYPYNQSCPGYSFPGCPSVAMGQIMKKWNWPSKGNGVIGGYTSVSGSYSYDIPNFLLANYTINWNNIPSQTTTYNKELADLLYFIGISVFTNYSPDGSGIPENSQGLNNVVNSYVNNFYFDASTIQIKSYDFWTTNDSWNSMLRSEINKGQPVQFFGDDGKDAHTWVCDGYDANNMFHMNWGWKSDQIGYYSTVASSQYSIYFPINQKVIIGIKPKCFTADLQISNPSASNSVVAGNSADISCQEYNTGTAYAGSNNLKVILSSTDVLYNNYTVLKTISCSGLASGSTSQTYSSSVTIPANTTPGQYYLFFWADADKTIGECWEDNNFARIPINITASSGTCSIPSNDNPCSGSTYATRLTFTTGSSQPVSSTSCGATNSGFATLGNTIADDDVFFYFTPTTSTATIAVTPASDYDAVFQLLTGTCGTNMSAVPTSGSYSNSGDVGVSERQTYTNLVTGQTYYIRVWHAGTGWGTSGNFNISVNGTSCSGLGTPYNLSPGTTSTTGQTIPTITPLLTWGLPSGATVYQVNISKYPYGYNNIVYTSDYLSTGSVTIPSGILLNGYNYRWDVTAYTSAGSSCYTISPDYYFNVNTGTACAAPTAQSTNITFSGISANNVTINWSVGNGERHVVKINTANNFNSLTNGTTPSPNTNYSGNGEQVVYDGSSNYVTISGLNANTTYYFKVYDVNCSGTMSMYNNNTSTNNPLSVTTSSGTTTCTVPTVAASGVSFSSIGTNSMTVNWTNGNGNKRIVKMNTFNGFTQPSDGTDPSYNNYWNNAGEQVIYNGTGNSISVSNLTPNIQYCFKVFEANCSGSNIKYSTDNQNNGGCQYTRQVCIPATAVPTPGLGRANCISQLPEQPVSMLYNSSGYNLYWSSTYASAFFEIEIYEYPFNLTNKVYSQTCINNLSVNIPASALTPGKQYCWRVRMSEWDCSCYGAWSQFYYFGISPQISIDNDIVICNGQGITLITPIMNVDATVNVEYLWYKVWYINNVSADIKVGTGSSYYVSSSGSYYVRTVYSGSTVCTGNDTTMRGLSYNVKIGTTPAAPTLTPNFSVCEGNRLALTATPPDNTNTYLYYWSGPNGFSSNGNNILIDGINNSYSGTYSCYLVRGGCPGPSGTVNVTVNPAPVASYTYTTSGNAVTFTNTSANASTYSWNFGDGQNSSAQSLSHTFVNGTYTVCLTANNANNCNPSTYCQSITIGGAAQVKTAPVLSKLITEPNNAHLQWQYSEFVQSPVDSSFVCAGTYYNATQELYLVRFFKIDKSGHLVWAREIPNKYSNYPRMIKSQNGYLLAFPYGNINAIMEFDEQGNTLWAKQVTIWSMTKVSNGYIMVSSASNGFDIFKIDNSGNVVWKKQWVYALYTDDGGQNRTQVYLRNIQQDASGNLFLSGQVYNSSTQGTASAAQEGLIIKLDNSGNHVWSKIIPTGLYDDVNGILVDNNNDVVFLNYSHSWDNATYSYILGKISSSGNLVTAKQLPVNNGFLGIINQNTTSNTYNFYGGNNNARAIMNLSSDLSIINKQKGINQNIHLWSSKPTLDVKFAWIQQYTVSAENSDYRYMLGKLGYNDTTCMDVDQVTSLFTLTPLSITLGTSTPSSGTSTTSTSSLSISTNVITLSDSNVCNTCNIKASITPSGVTTFCHGDNVSLSANAGMSSYLWSNGKTTPSINVVDSSSYTVTITDNNNCTATSNPVNVIVFAYNNWTGTISSDWTNANNWSCGKVPDANSDVKIPAGTPYSPVVPTGVIVSCRTLNVMKNAILKVNTNAKLVILH